MLEAKWLQAEVERLTDKLHEYPGLAHEVVRIPEGLKQDSENFVFLSVGRRRVSKEVVQRLRDLLTAFSPVDPTVHRFSNAMAEAHQSFVRLGNDIMRGFGSGTNG